MTKWMINGRCSSVSSTRPTNMAGSCLETLVETPYCHAGRAHLLLTIAAPTALPLIDDDDLYSSRRNIAFENRANNRSVALPLEWFKTVGCRRSASLRAGCVGAGAGCAKGTVSAGRRSPGLIARVLGHIHRPGVTDGSCRMAVKYHHARLPVRSWLSFRVPRIMRGKANRFRAEKL